MRANVQQPTSVQEQAGDQAKNTQNDLGAPSWLRVKSKIKAGPGGGGGEKEFGKGPAEPKKVAGPTWLRIKSQIKAGPTGDKDFGKGSAGYHRTDVALTRLAARIKRPFTD